MSCVPKGITVEGDVEAAAGESVEICHIPVLFGENRKMTAATDLFLVISPFEVLVRIF